MKALDYYSPVLKKCTILLRLTTVPAAKPRNPNRNIAAFLSNLSLEQARPWVTVSMMAGAMRARVELDTLPTNEMKRSSLK